jgi:hypothetical protein
LELAADDRLLVGLLDAADGTFLVLCKEERELMALPMWISPYWEITIYALL